eukprot:58496_1
MCWGNHDQEDHEDVDFVDLEAQTGKQPAPPDLDRVRSGSMSGLKLTTANVAWAVGGLLLLVFALFVAYRVFDAKNSTNNGLEAEYLAWEQTRPADQQLLADQQRLADQRLAGQSGAEEQGALEEQKRLANEQATAASSIIPTGNVASYNNPPIATGAYHEEAKERQRGLTELQRKSDTLKKERVAKKQQEQKEERRKHLALTAEHRREMQKLADEQEEKEREELAATATRQSGFDSIIPTVNFSYRPIAANGFSADKEEVKEIRETEDDDEMEMDKWIKEEEKRENDVVKPRSFGVLSQNSAPQQPKRNHPSGTALPTYMPGPLFPPSNNVVKPRSHGVLSQPQLPQNQLDSGNGSSIQHVIQRTQSHAPLQYSNQSQTQLIQPVAPLSFSNTDWECPQCTTKNEGSEKKCRICSKPNPALTEDPEQKVDSPQQDPNKQSSMKANDEVGDQNARGPNDDANRNFFADFGIKDLQRQQTEGQNRLEAAQKAKAAFEAEHRREMQKRANERLAKMKLAEEKEKEELAALTEHPEQKVDSPQQDPNKQSSNLETVQQKAKKRRVQELFATAIDGGDGLLYPKNTKSLRTTGFQVIASPPPRYSHPPLSHFPKVNVSNVSSLVDNRPLMVFFPVFDMAWNNKGELVLKLDEDSKTVLSQEYVKSVHVMWQNGLNNYWDPLSADQYDEDTANGELSIPKAVVGKMGNALRVAFEVSKQDKTTVFIASASKSIPPN